MSIESLFDGIDESTLDTTTLSGESTSFVWDTAIYGIKILSAHFKETKKKGGLMFNLQVEKAGGKATMLRYHVLADGKPTQTRDGVVEGLMGTAATNSLAQVLGYKSIWSMPKELKAFSPFPNAKPEQAYVIPELEGKEVYVALVKHTSNVTEGRGKSKKILVDKQEENRTVQFFNSDRLSPGEIAAGSTIAEDYAKVADWIVDVSTYRVPKNTAASTSSLDLGEINL